MPRQANLLEIKGRYYLNMQVPKELRPLYGKKEIIRKSLHTSDRGEAISLVRYEACKLDSDFQAKRRELKRLQNPPALRSVSDREAHDLVFRWFINQERLSEDWWDKEGSKFDEEDAALALDNLRTEEVVFSGGSKHFLAEDGSSDLDLFLKSEGLDCPKDSPAYQKLDLKTCGERWRVSSLGETAVHQEPWDSTVSFCCLLEMSSPTSKHTERLGDSTGASMQRLVTDINNLRGCSFPSTQIKSRLNFRLAFQAQRELASD